MTLCPVTLTDARRFVAEHHRHNGPPVGWRFGVGVEHEGRLVGVATAGTPKSRVLAGDPLLLEVNRTCTDGTPHVNSMLYGAIARAAAALGYRSLITYTLQSESGASLRATGWTLEAVSDREAVDWLNREHPTLFGDGRRMPDGPKFRWRKTLGRRS